MEKTQFELIQLEKCTLKGSSLFISNRTIFIIGRDKENNKKIFFISDFFPRFFVEKDESVKNILENVPEIKEHIKEIKTKEDGLEYNYKNLGGKQELITIFTYKTNDVPEIREYFTKTYEANIKFTEVFKREMGIKDKFFVPKYILENKKRIYKIKGIEYILLYKKDISGGELEF